MVWSTPVCRYCGVRLVLVRDHQQADEDQRARGDQRQCAADAPEPGAGRELGPGLGGGRLGGRAHGGSFQVRAEGSFASGETFARPASRLPGTAAPCSWDGMAGAAPSPPDRVACPCPFGSAAGRMSAVPGTTDSRTPAPGLPRWVPGALAALGVGCTLVALALGALADGGRPVDAGDATLALLYPLVGALVLGRQPGNKVGWLLMVSVVTGPYLLAAQYLVLTGIPTEGFLPSLAAWLCAWGFVPYFVIVALVPLYFPDGTLPSPRWRWVARTLTVVVVVGAVAAMFRDGPLDYVPELRNPLAIPGLWVSAVVLFCSFTSFLIGGAARRRGPARAHAAGRGRPAHPAAVVAPRRVGAGGLHDRLGRPRPAGDLQHPVRGRVRRAPAGRRGRGAAARPVRRRPGDQPGSGVQRPVRPAADRLRGGRRPPR